MFRAANPSYDEAMSLAQSLENSTSRVLETMAADPEAHRRAGLEAFLEAPPNPSDIRRAIAEAERLEPVIGPTIRQIDQESGDLRCHWCNSKLSALMKWALVPLIVTEQPKTTLACLACLDRAYILPNREARLSELSQKSKKGFLGLSRTELVSAAPGFIVFILLFFVLADSESLLGSLFSAALGGLMAQAIGSFGLLVTTRWVAVMSNRDPDVEWKKKTDDPLAMTPALLFTALVLVAAALWI